MIIHREKSLFFKNTSCRLYGSFLISDALPEIWKRSFTIIAWLPLHNALFWIWCYSWNLLEPLFWFKNCSPYCSYHQWLWLSITPVLLSAIDIFLAPFFSFFLMFLPTWYLSISSSRWKSFCIVTIFQVYAKFMLFLAISLR